MDHQPMTIGTTSYYNKPVLNFNNIKFVSDKVIERAKSKVGDLYFTKISEDLITNSFEEIRRSRPNFAVRMDNSYNLLEDLLELTIQKITEYVVVHHYDTQSKKDYSIWNTVGIYTPDNYTAINVKKQTSNPTFDTQFGEPRF